MKTAYFLVFLIFTIGCSKVNISTKDKTKESQNIYSYIEQKVDSIHHELEESTIEPDYTVVTQNDTITIDNILIEPFQTNEGLNIKVNDFLIQTFKFTTLNDAENGKVEVNFANNLRKVKYYKSNQLLVFELNFTPCTGLGCLIEFHLIYNLKNNNLHPFGIFRNYNSELYRFKNIDDPIYLAKSYEGDLHEGKFTYEYNFFKIKKVGLKPLIIDNQKVNILIQYDNYIPINMQINKLSI